MSFVKRKMFSTLTGHIVLFNRAFSLMMCFNYLISDRLYEVGTHECITPFLVLKRENFWIGTFINN